MSDPEPAIRPGFEVEHFSDLNASELESMETLVKAGLTGTEAHEIIKGPNIGRHRLDVFMGLLKLGLDPREIRDNFSDYQYAFLFASDKDGHFRKFSAWELRRFVKLTRQGKMPSQALASLRQGGGCMVVLAVWIVAAVSLAGWSVR